MPALWCPQMRVRVEKIDILSCNQSLENFSSSNTLLTFPNIIDPESSVFINNEIPVSHDINEDNSTHKCSAGVIVHACYYIHMN